MEETGIRTFAASNKDKTFLSQSRPLYTTDRREEGDLVVEPNEIRFDEVEPGVLYIMTFSVRNNTKVAQRIRISPPHSGYFALNYIPCGAVAPGLDIRAEIECQLPVDTTELMYTDKIVATMGSFRVEVPIFACKPYANIAFERAVEGGDIVMTYPLTMDLVFENKGPITGKIKISESLNKSETCIKSIQPNKFDLDPVGGAKTTQSVRVTIEAKDVGKWAELLKVSIAGAIDDSLIELSANFIEPKLTLITSDQQGLLENATFGNAFYGETKVVTGMLVNSGPLPLSFAAVYEDEEEENGEIPQTDDITAHYTRSLTMVPYDGFVKAFSSIPIDLVFKPKVHIPEKGFAKAHVEDNRAPRAITRRVHIDCGEAEQRLSVTMQGTASAPAVFVSPSTLRFGDCPVNDRRDILIEVSNKGKFVTSFEFPVIANFKFEPNRGRLQGSETVSVVASFLPPQLGKFKSNVKMAIAGGLSVYEVHCIGTSARPGERKHLVGGVDLLPDDFTKQLKFVNPEEETAARYEQQRELERTAVQAEQALKTNLKAKLGNTDYLALPRRAPPAAAPAAAAAATMHHHQPATTTAAAITTTTGDAATAETGEGAAAAATGAAVGEGGMQDAQPQQQQQGADMMPPPAADLVSTASSRERDYIYGLTDLSLAKPLDASHPMLVKRDHNRAYNDFLQQSYARRKENQRARKHKSAVARGAVDFSDPFGVNMGIERGLEEPDLRIPQAGELLWLANGASAEGGGDGSGGGGSRIPADENRLIVKKYNSTPATQAELRDCSAELSQDDIKLVSGSHKLLDFGRVSVGSLSAKNFSVANDLNQCVMVKVEELDAELSQSKHLCQIIPQGCLAGFDIYFSSRHIGKVKKVFVWKINNLHVSKVVVTAEVVPIELIMSTQEMCMEFPFDSLEPTLSSDFILQNPGNAPADFLWGNAGAFQCLPESGTINAGDSSIITITWSPLSGKRNEEELGLHITGGVDQTLKVKGVLLETKAEFVEKRLGLGTMAVGTEKVVTAQIRNVGDHPLAFFLNPIDDRLGIRASPEEDLIQPGETSTLTLSITPSQACTYDNTLISVKVRGGKQVSVKLTGASIIPELTLAESAFDFGSVTVGAESRLPLTISNSTSILTTMILDLTDHPDFTPYIRGAENEEEDLMLASVVGAVNHEQEDLLGNQIILSKTGATGMHHYNDGGASSISGGVTGGSGGGRRKKNIKKNIWNLLILPNATLKADLVFRPTSAKQKHFKLPLFLQGIFEDKSFNREVTATSIASTLSISTYVVDFGDRVVSRDPLSRISYFLETEIKNVASKRGVEFEVREMPDVVKEFGDAPPAPPADPTAVGMDDANNKIFFVAPLKGDLGPGASMPIRVTFQPQSSANYSKKLELYIKDQVNPNRPYLTLLCQGSGVFPRLTFSHQHVELPNVPLGISSRATFIIFNNGYNSLSINHRVSPNIPVPLEITYPDGQNLGIMVQKIRVVVAAKSDTPISWAGKIEFFDQDGERFVVSVSGCTDGCLLTNYPFVRDYASDYGFIGMENQPVRYLKKSLIAELRLLETKRKEEQRRLRSLERKRAVESKMNEDSKDGKKGAGGKDDASQVSKASSKSAASKTGKSAANILAIAASKVAHEAEGVDMDKPPPAFYSDQEVVFLLKWLNKNICRKEIDYENFPHCVVDGNGDLVIDCIEAMSGKKIPGIKPSDFTEPGAPGATLPGSAAANKRRDSNDNADQKNGKKKNSEKANKILATNKLVFKFQQLLNFLINNGALLSHLSPVELLGLEEYLVAQEMDLLRDKGTRFTPAMLNERRKFWESHWLDSCKKTWLQVLYQSIKVFVLSRLNYKTFSSMPGVVIVNQEEEGSVAADAEKGGKDEKKKGKKGPSYPKDLVASNVFSHAEAVLLQWASYHLERAVKLKDEGASGSGSGAGGGGASDASKFLSFERRVVDIDADFTDVVGFCQLLHAHVDEVTASGRPLTGYTLYERNKGEDYYHNLEEALAQLHMELDTSYEEVTSSTRSLMLMLLHLYLHLPNLVPKTKIEFVGELGTPILKQIELKNPSRKPLEYSISLTGSPDFTAQGERLTIPAESSSQFVVTLNAKFVAPVHGKLMFWSQKESGFAGTTMCFDLVSKITGRKPIETMKKEMHLYELENFQVTVKSPFPKDTTYSVSLQVQSVPLSVEECIAMSRGMTMEEVLAGLAATAAAGGGGGGGKGGKAAQKPKRKELAPVTSSIENVDVSVMSAAERKFEEEQAELELTFRQPFWCAEETVSVSKGHPRTITLYALPFTMGRFVCQVVFAEKDTGEFCKEIIADVGLPKPSDRLDFPGFKDTRVNLAMRLASKNAAFEKAFAMAADMRIKNNTKKVRARSIYTNMLASPVVNEETGQSHFTIDFLSQFFDFNRNVPFVSEYMRLKQDDAETAGSTGAASRQKNTAQANKYKKMLKTLIEALPPEEFNSMDTLNTTPITFVPPRAGHYHSLAVVRSRDNSHDVRVVELQSAVSMPDAKMGLEFRGPARQKLTQQIPIKNESSTKDWSLVVTCQGNGFSAPKTLQIPKGQTVAVEVSFFAPKAGSFAGQLLLRNTSESGDNFDYKLIGEAEDPLAEDDLQFECTARLKKSLSFSLPATSAAAAGGPPRSPMATTRKEGEEAAGASVRVKPKKYTVESDLPYVRFQENIEVPADNGEFQFTINAPVGGVFPGTFTFTDVDTGGMFWYTVTVEVAAPKEERVIDVESVVRKAAVVDILLENPTEEVLVFTVHFAGDGLLGEEVIQLPPLGTAAYELIYSPLLAGEHLGRISFTNELVGVLWYKLNLKALPANPVVLEPIESMIGSSNFIVAPIDNPTPEQVSFSVFVEDAHFSVVPDQLTLGPYEQSTFQVHYRPSSLTDRAHSKVILSNEKFGEIQYEAEGISALPGVLPTVYVDAPLAEIGSQTIVFRNPFPHPLPLDIELTPADAPTDPKSLRHKKAIEANLAAMATAFGLLMRKTADVVVPAQSSYHIALSFSPEKMGSYEAVVQVRSVVGGRSLLWRYPVFGMAEAGVAQRFPAMRTPCKTTLMKEFNVNLDGIRASDLQPDEFLKMSDFSVEIIADNDTVKSMVNRSFRAQPLEVVTVDRHGEGASAGDFALRCRMLFEPLRTFIASVEIIVVCRNRGKWRVKIDLDATEPEPDDTIKLVAPVGGSDKVTFKLNNRFLGYSSFQAYYSAKSSPHFSVEPAVGTLAPYGAEGTSFVVTFSPVEYGTIETGTLIIVTDDAQWTYEVKGSYPSNTINHAAVKSKIDNGRK